MKILVIDDDTALLEAVKRMLVHHGHEVDCSDNAADAVKMVQKAEYDFILLDYWMPDRDGMWFMKNVKVPRKTKTLLVTAFVNRGVINEMFKLGASGYVIKPFDENELLHHLAFHSLSRGE